MVLKEQMMMQADYTRKTQDVAEQRRLQMQREEQFNELAQRQQANFSIYSELATIDKQLEEYKEVDWVELTSKNPQLAQQQQQYRNQLIADRQEAVKKLEQAEGELNQRQQQYMQTNLRQTMEGLKSSIPDYTPFVENMEIPKEDTKLIINAGFDKMEKDKPQETTSTAGADEDLPF